MIYLDNAATSWPKPEIVYKAMDDCMRQGVGNPGRSAHGLSLASGRVLYNAREALSRLMAIDNPLRIIFTKNATEALNLAIKGVLRQGDHVITSSMEHNSVMRPLRAMEDKGIELSIIECSCEGFLDPLHVKNAIRPNTRLIVLNHASNVVGTLLPVFEVGEIARRHGVLFCVDAAQTAGVQVIDVNAMNVDLLAFTGHKSLYGPQGTGGLYIRDGLDSSPEPLQHGGTGSRSDHEFQPEFLPDKYESGTPNTVGIAGLFAGVEFVLSEGIDSIREHEEMITNLLIEGLSNIEHVTVYGCHDVQKQVAVVSFNIHGFNQDDVALRLEDDYGIMCRVGLQCAPLAHKTVGTFPEGTIRLSPSHFTTKQDIALLLQAVSIIARETK